MQNSKLKVMAKTELPAEIQSISGAVGCLLYKTYHKVDGTTVTRVYRNPYYKRPGEKTSGRSTALTAKERAVRVQFAHMARAVSARINAGDKRTRKEIWKEVKEEYETRES